MKRHKGVYERIFKRPLDLLCGIVTVVVFFWLYFILIILGMIFMRGNPFFMQERPGLHEKIFKLIKFRTMDNRKDENGKLLPDEVRLNKYGRFLRSTSFDELPEVFNIIRGDMSVIGPRPQLVRDMVFMTPEQRLRHTVKPGLSGLAQTRGRNAISWDRKLSTDLEYVANVTFLGDIKIILDTVKQVFFKQKGIKGSDLDEVEITDDLGDYLLKAGRVTKEEYEAKQNEARGLLGG